MVVWNVTKHQQPYKWLPSRIVVSFYFYFCVFSAFFHSDRILCRCVCACWCLCMFKMQPIQFEIVHSKHFTHNQNNNERRILCSFERIIVYLLKLYFILYQNVVRVYFAFYFIFATKRAAKEEKMYAFFSF